MIKNIIGLLLIFSILMFYTQPCLGVEDDYIPELISLDIKGMDIKDVLKILSQKSGLNIIADSDVRGNIQLYVTDVDVMEALDIVVSTNGLAYEEEGSLIRVMTDNKYKMLHGKIFKDRTITEIVKLNYASADDIVKSITQMKTDIGKIVPDERSNTIVLIDNPETVERMKDAIREMDTSLITEVFSLDYAKAEQIKEKLNEVISKDIGSTRFDERTNKVIVKDTPKKIEEVRKIIEAFDEKTREVSIEAHIIQVSLADKYSHGINWDDVARAGDLSLTTDVNLSAGLTNVTTSTFTLIDPRNFTAVLSLLETYGKTKILSKPRITVMNKEEAKILVGAKEAYVTSEVTTTDGGTYHTTDNVEFVDVGVSLRVTPEINNKGFIILKIKPEVSSSDSTKTVELTNPDGSTRTIIPYVTTSETETTVIVKDNTTLIIGGLMKDTIIDNEQKVPFLGDLPFLGNLFTTIGKSKEKTELVIFITPHIIEGDETTEEVKGYIDKFDNQMKKSRIDKTESIATKKKPVRDTIGNEDKDKWTPIFNKKDQKKDKVKDEVRAQAKEVRVQRQDDTSSLGTPHAEYYKIVESDVKRIAGDRNDGSLRGRAELRFTLDRKGFIVKGPIVFNNPDLEVARAAVNAVKMASPFPPFPRGMKERQADFYIVLIYE
ncbi:MAG: secretin N-terminal domain-containing protein [Candidatus Omnitrophota bacterium]